MMHSEERNVLPLPANGASDGAAADAEDPGAARSAIAFAAAGALADAEAEAEHSPILTPRGGTAVAPKLTVAACAAPAAATAAVATVVSK